MCFRYYFDSLLNEMGHGFDDQGSKSDANGIQRNWWTDEDRAAFDAKADKLAAQYSKYEPIPGNFVNGLRLWPRQDPSRERHARGEGRCHPASARSSQLLHVASGSI